MKKKSESKTKPLLRTIVISLVLFAAVATMTAGIATTQSATRTLPAEPVLPGVDFDVGIEAHDYGIMGQVIETIPEGFTYVSSPLEEGAVEIDGNTIKFTLLGVDSFTYTVTASSVAGTYEFSGILKDSDKNEYPVGGDTEVIVQGVEPTPTSTPTPTTTPTPSPSPSPSPSPTPTPTLGAAYATRDLPEQVSPGANFEVGIEAHDYGAFGQVVETLPDGFTYVSSTLDPDSVEVVDSTVKFALWDETSFTYTVTASSEAGTYEFSGILKDEYKNEYEVGGDTEITVEEIIVPLRANPDGPYSGYVDEEIALTGSASGGEPPYSYAWDFDYDGVTFDVESTEQNPTHVWTAAGTYTVALKVTDSASPANEDIGTTTVRIKVKPTATRILPEEPVSPSANFEVGIQAKDYGVFGQVVETLPDGFTYVSSTLDPGSVNVVDSTVKFTLFGETSFTYTVTASSVAGTYEFNGILKDECKNEYEVGGDTEVTVLPEPLEVIRAISKQIVAPDDIFTVTVVINPNQDIYALILDEDLPAGWNATPIENDSAIYDATEVSWLWMEMLVKGTNKTVIYNVTVPHDVAEGNYSITGTVSAFGIDSIAVAGESVITVPPPPEASEVSISTDKTKYHPSDIMEVSINIDNPSVEEEMFEWYLVKPQFDYCLPVHKMLIPAVYEDTIDVQIEIGEWGSSPFAALWYVHLLDQNGEALDQGCACWAYSPGRDKGEKAMPVDIAEEIGGIKTNISFLGVK